MGTNITMTIPVGKATIRLGGEHDDDCHNQDEILAMIFIYSRYDEDNQWLVHGGNPRWIIIAQSLQKTFSGVLTATQAPKSFLLLNAIERVRRKGGRLKTLICSSLRNGKTPPGTSCCDIKPEIWLNL